jgi:hypothetical protein
MNIILKRQSLIAILVSLFFMCGFALSIQTTFAIDDRAMPSAVSNPPSSDVGAGTLGGSAAGGGTYGASGVSPSSPAPVQPLLFNIPNPFGTQSFTLFDFVKRIVALATQIAIPVIILLIIYAGFEFVRAQGAPEAINKAKDTLLYTLIGAGIIFGANVIALAVEATVKNLIQ